VTPLWIILKGLAAGLAIAVPVGPVNVLCASKTLTKGRASGLVCGLGAATADSFYGGIAAFSITFVIDWLRREQFWIRVIGGLLLIGIGIIFFRRPPQSLDRETEDKAVHSDYVTTLLLTFTNPTTVLSFLAVLAALGTSEHRIWWLNFLLVGGIFCGSMLWWTVLVHIVDRLRDRFDQRTICWMNRIAGLAIGAFGVLTFTLGITSRP
jgi:threonine/homoserine/homoserine lactone efflux protein